MSMQVNNMGIALAASGGANDIGVSCWFRGMVAGSPQGGTGGGHGSVGVGRGGESVPPNRPFGAPENAGVEDGAGTSRSRARRGGRLGDGESSSEAE